MFAVGSAPWVLILGLLIGFLAAWIFDFFYWRRPSARPAADADQGGGPGPAVTRAERDRLQADLGAARAERDRLQADLGAARAERDRLQADLRACGERGRSLEADLRVCGERGRDLEADLGAARAERDRLQADLRVCGERGRGLEADLGVARARAAELEPLAARRGELQAERDQLAAELVEARARLGRLEADLSDCGARVGELTVDLSDCGARASELRAAKVRLEVELAAARAAVPTGSALGGAADADDAHDLRGLALRLQDENVLLSDELSATRAALVRVAGPQRDPLIDINGIGPAYQERLYEAGVVTFEQLGAMTPAQLKEVILPADWQTPAFAAWVAEARRRAGQPERDALIDIDGIGPVYERRLVAAGVATFEQLAALSPERVYEIVSPAAWQKVEPAAWIAEARARARQLRDGTEHKGES